MTRTFSNLVLLAMLVAACAGPNTSAPVAEQTTEPTSISTEPAFTLEPTDMPDPTIVATDIPVATVVPTEVPDPTAAPTPTEILFALFDGMPQGRTNEGFAFLGNPDAPVTVTDYSDFL
ncbi:MAG: Protein-disulfide isomerase [Chloroflexi bacterium AL-W]|nr:Protein-disulfide isomerase [Chloroflexi bacterium AL-N1]NOK71126.1 Protein-disulfide isomerase [Chloroflexi bacterium AL-N10]NOK78592.1 Protein-disulfide isomerase [Chloroflexi bacterium AL-N5]NOK85888.1 Protein-disulfide isomerase [Chloroflexi bacterium AL-W]NOK92863.1 Protein-disulfide isomerase [Chloroflexi bacterium AL-N15]